MPRLANDHCAALASPASGAMADQGVKLFVSCVSDEFRGYRNALRHVLTRPKIEVKIQEDFKPQGGDTLSKLEEHIAHCEVVVHNTARGLRQGDPGLDATRTATSSASISRRNRRTASARLASVSASAPPRCPSSKYPSRRKLRYDRRWLILPCVDAYQAIRAPPHTIEGEPPPPPESVPSSLRSRRRTSVTAA
jgi:hypothetical protein